MTRNSGLDITRSIAILLVLFCHLYSHNCLLLNFDTPPFVKMMGWFGVDLFFVLSGFLIGKILIKTLFEDKSILEQKKNGLLMNFYKRRWFRTLPLYYFMLGVNLLIYLALTNDINYLLDFKKILSYVFFLQKILHYWNDSLTFENAHFMGESWTLCIEEFFYLFFPLIMIFFIFLNKKDAIEKIKKKFLYVVLSLISLLLFIKIIGTLFYDFSTGFVHYFTLFRFEGLLIGFLLAYIYSEHPNFYKKLTKKTTLCLSLIILFLLINHLLNPLLVQGKYWSGDFFSKTFAYIFLALIWANLIAFLENFKTRKNIFFEITSKISYSIYLINSIIIQFLGGFIFTGTIYFSSLLGINKGNLINLIFYNFALILIIYSVSIILYKFFEQPIMKLRDIA